MKNIIRLNWKNIDENTPQEHIEALQESGMARATEMIAEGYHSGELHDNIHMLDSDPEEGVYYSGWWYLEEDKEQNMQFIQVVGFNGNNVALYTFDENEVSRGTVEHALQNAMKDAASDEEDDDFFGIVEEQLKIYNSVERIFVEELHTTYI